MTGLLAAWAPVIVPFVTAILGWLQGRSSHKKLERDLDFRKKLEDLPNNTVALQDWDRMIQHRVRKIAQAGATWIRTRTRAFIGIALLVLFGYLITEALISYLTLIKEENRFYDATLELQLRQLTTVSLWVQGALWVIALLTAISYLADMYSSIQDRKGDRSSAASDGTV